MTAAPAEPYIGPTHVVIAETLRLIATNTQVWQTVDSLRRVEQSRAHLLGVNPALAANLDERLSAGLESLSLRLAERLTDRGPNASRNAL